MPFTTDERKSFTAAKLAQIDRFDAARLDAMLALDNREGAPEPTKDEQDAHRTKTLGRLANMPADQLRAYVNCAGWSAGVTFAAENDYTAGEQAAISAGWKANVGRYFHKEADAILAARAEGLAAGLTEAQVLFVLRNR